VSVFLFSTERLKPKLSHRNGVAVREDCWSNLRTGGFSPRRVIDVVAFHGDRLLASLEAFASASLLMIKSQPDLSRLRNRCHAQPRLKPEAALRMGNVLTTYEVIACLKGYPRYDIIGFNHRPGNKALRQVNLIFVRKDSSLLTSHG
jgi:hypothetical protein